MHLEILTAEYICKIVYDETISPPVTSVDQSQFISEAPRVP